SGRQASRRSRRCKWLRPASPENQPKKRAGWTLLPPGPPYRPLDLRYGAVVRWGVAQPSSSDQRSARPGVLTVARTLRPAGTSPAVRGSLPEMHLRTRVLPLGMGATATLHAIITSSGSAGHPEVYLSAQARRAPSQSAEGSRRGRFEKGKADQDLCGRSAAPARRQGPSRRRTIPGGVTPAAAPGNGVARGKSPFHV